MLRKLKIIFVISNLLLLLFVCIFGIAAFHYFPSLNKKIEEQVLEKNTSKTKATELPKIIQGTKTVILIPEGKFTMGDDNSNFPDEKPEHSVTVKYIYINEETPSVNNIPIEPESQSLQPKVIDKLLPLSNSEINLEADDVTHVVIHFASNVTAKPTNPYIPEDIINIFKQYGISTHYLIARDGTIFRLVDEKRNAYHAGRGSLSDYPHYKDKLNRHSIGIEILAIGTEEEMKQYISPEIYRSIPKNNIGYTDEQYIALNSLLPGIYQRHDIKIDRQHVIGHNEYSVGRKEDPGILFDWSKIGL